MPLSNDEIALFGGSNLNVSLDRASRRDPDKWSQSLSLAAERGLPVGVVDRNTPEITRRKQLDDIDLSQHPKTSKWLEDEDNASVAIDDLDILKRFEDTVNTIYDDDVFDKMLRAGRAAAAGLGPSFAASAYGIPESMAALLSEYVGAPLAEARVLPEDPFARVQAGFGEIRKGQERLATAVRGTREGMGSTEQAIYSGFESFGRQIPGGLLAVLTGNPAFMYGTTGATVASESMTEALDKGLTPLDALLFGVGQGGTEILFEKIPALKLFGDLKAGSSLFTTLTNQLAIEIPAEQATTLVQDLNTWAALNPDKTFDSYLEERPEAAYQTLIATVVGTGLQTGAIYTADAVLNTSERNIREAAKSVFEQQTLDNIVMYAQSSATNGRASKRFESFINTLGADREVLIPQEIAQQLEGMPDYITEQFDGLGGNVSVPLRQFASEIATNDEWMNAIRPHIKLSESSLSQTEIEEGGADKGLQELLKRAQASQETLSEAERIFDTVKDQLVATGMQSELTARLSAQLYPASAAVYVEKARKLGKDLTVNEAFEMMGFSVQFEQVTPEPDGGVILDQAQESGYEGESTGEAQEWVAAVAKGLDMSQKGRMERAEAAGFDTAQVLYHGSNEAGFREFSLPVGRKTDDTGIFVTDDLTQAKSYQSGRGEIVEIHTGEELFNDPGLMDDLEIVTQYGIVNDKGRVISDVYDYDSFDDFKSDIKDGAVDESDDGQPVELYTVIDPDGYEVALEATKEDAVNALDDVEQKQPGVLELYVKLNDENTLTVDWKGQNWDESPIEEWGLVDSDDDVFEWVHTVEEARSRLESDDKVVEIQEGLSKTTDEYARDAREMGFDAIRFLNIVDPGPYSYGGEEGNVTVVFDPKNVRSVNAAFDPAYRESGQLLAQSQDFQDVQLTEDRTISETGETVTITQDAQRLWEQTQKRHGIVSQLKECLSA